MCTAVSFGSAPHCFGRNLDIDRGYGESIVVMPRNFPLRFRAARTPENRYALIGMAHAAHGYPLFYDATNEAGLSAAGLRFPGAVYPAARHGADNVGSFELIPWVLCQCTSAAEAKSLLERTNVCPIAFSESLPPTELHWLIADREHSIAVEPTADGLAVYDDRVGVLTNAPAFPHHMQSLAYYAHLSDRPHANTLAPGIDLVPNSLGTGSFGLPGDLTSPSRFIKAAFTALRSVCEDGDAVNQTFHILGSVEQQRGCVRVGDGYELTLYTSCCDTDSGIYYCRTYSRSRITAVDMHSQPLDGAELSAFPLPQDEDVCFLDRNVV